ncbi:MULTISPECIES: hypothetical protein [Stenotrophomonas]|uniref:Uncharacterized protein n=1 Tax=Stenotrophomonas maltophilia TaxID=40324 RepID=A0A2J0UBD8_STEMA|nr:MULTISPECIES: hypothetical protein [Stenotrophomonas]PJL28381.1 hypothetical protein B9Y64_14290 [Stenotrophomonas maltophilia]DAH67265.1 MAG TPA: hypothetical protein [Caudoviricetes sp.]HDS1147147.1 hypothetical protein [Stenotrophomonas maltophilia]HDS1160804.1 hypothetical protein [Stenotrophomonas maltophilia]
MYQLTEEIDTIRCLQTGAFIPRGHRLWNDYEAWCTAGNEPEPVPPPFAPGSTQFHRFIRGRAWEWMAQCARDRGYDSIESCCSYAGSAVPRYAQDAIAMIAWRDGVNLALEAIESTTGVTAPDWQQVQAQLPQPAAFGWPAEQALEIIGG